MIRREHAPASSAPSEAEVDESSSSAAHRRIVWTDDSPEDREHGSVTGGDEREDLMADQPSADAGGAAESGGEPPVGAADGSGTGSSEQAHHDDDSEGAADADDVEPGILYGSVAPHESRPAELLAFDLAAVPTADIQCELDRRQSAAHKLMVEKSRLLSRVAQLDREISRLSGHEDEAPRLTPLPTPVRRDLSDLSLSDAIAKVYGIGDEFSPAEVEERLAEHGYQSRVANLRTAVTQVLAKELRFKRLARGVYLRTG